MNDTYAVIIIGAGIVGCALARELSRYERSILVLERGGDVSVGATRANSGIVHGGYTAKAGTLKGELSIRGNRMYAQLADELGFPYSNIGSHVLAFSDEDCSQLESLLQNGRANGVRQLEIRTREQVLSREPAVNPKVTAALHCGETGIVSPYEAAIALAENAVENGVELALRSEVTAIEDGQELFTVTAGGRRYRAPVLINAAGLYSDRIAAMLGEKSFTIIPRKGEYLLLKRGAASLSGSVIFQTPTKHGKGVLVTPTTWGNLMIGPNAEETDDRDDASNSPQALEQIIVQARLSMPELDLKSLIRFFTGVRATPDTGDFIIGEGRTPGFIQAAGIESPGLTAAPAIAEKVRDLLLDRGWIRRRPRAFTADREPVTLPGELRPMQEILPLTELPEGDPQRIVCRCEQVSEAVIRDALSRGIPVDSLDAVKRRTRAGMGACQGTFCGPRVAHLVSEAAGIDEKDVIRPVPKDRGLLSELKKQ